jgi:hypothetical protein
MKITRVELFATRIARHTPELCVVGPEIRVSKVDGSIPYSWLTDKCKKRHHQGSGRSSSHRDNSVSSERSAYDNLLVRSERTSRVTAGAACGCDANEHGE